MQTYDFLERVYDATRNASDGVLGTMNVAVVRAKEESNTITTHIFQSEKTKAGNLLVARMFVTDDGAYYYVIGADIETENENG